MTDVQWNLEERDFKLRPKYVRELQKLCPGKIKFIRNLGPYKVIRINMFRPSITGSTLFPLPSFDLVKIAGLAEGMKMTHSGLHIVTKLFIKLFIYIFVLFFRIPFPLLGFIFDRQLSCRGTERRERLSWPPRGFIF